ncbi:LamG-like jellyroll fold domain-containing protein [Candidatus Latescibacterota bacterium]
MLSRFILIALLLYPALSAAEKGPVTSHLTFETLDFMKDDYVGKISDKTPEGRKLSITDGKFGKALLMGAPSVKLNEDGYNHTYLDMITTVTIWRRNNNKGYEEPFLWGSGKIHPAYGAVAFWIKGPSSPCTVFEQTTTTWGRTERQLIEVHLERDGSISAYVEDARYVQHKVRTKPLWRENQWHHIVFMWDRSSGVELWVDGKNVRSTMGTDAWWDNQKVGLFRLPMFSALYDEFYTFSRPLTAHEVADLYSKNTPPVDSPADLTYDSAAIDRLKDAFSDDTSRLPVVRPWSENTIVVTRISPVRIQDEGVAGWFVDDGRYESAWPWEYGIYTDTPGDVDYHAERADLLPPEGVDVNFITLEGNLDGAKVLAGDRNGTFEDNQILTAPRGNGLFYGAVVDNAGDREFRIPFTKEYGVPPGFESDILKLPLSGDLRIHEVGLFNVAEKPLSAQPGDQTLYLVPDQAELDRTKYQSALNTLLPAIDRSRSGLYGNTGTHNPSAIQLSPMIRHNLFSEPSAGKSCYKLLLLDMWIQSKSDENVLIVKVANPGVPSQVWSHAEVQLKGFSGKPSRLRLALAFDPVFLMPGDRMWLQLLATEGLSIVTGDPSQPSVVILRPELNTVWAEQKFSFRTMLPNRNTYSGMFEWMPWRYMEETPHVDTPEHFGGPFDMLYPWQAVLKVNPGDRIATIYKEYATGKYGSGGRPRNWDNIPRKTYDAPENAPDWAVHFRELQTFRGDIITWYRHHQRSDGQVGGGWNDDTLVFSRGYSDLPLDSNPDALALYNNVFDGFDKTNYFRDGYCRIWPIDDWHNGDFVRERYKSLIFNLGDPRSATWAMEEAWHWDKPDKTPVNFGDGQAFLFGKDVLEWYWNKRTSDEPYVLKERDKVLDIIRRGADAVNEAMRWRFTEARVHTDDQRPYGGDNLHDVLHGGWNIPPERRYRPDVTITVGVGWIEGGGPDLGRLVEYSSHDGLKVGMYSFDPFDRVVTMRIFRLDNGRYTVTLSADKDGNGSYETTISQEKKRIRRFDRLTVTVPSRLPVKLDISQVKADRDPGPLPDLSVSGYYVTLDGGTLRATVHNIGCAPSGKFMVSVLDGDGKKVAQKQMESIESAEDFVPKNKEIVFTGLPKREHYTIVIDPKNKVNEIYEENNEATVSGN